MTTFTLHIPDDLSKQAREIGLLNEQSILQAFRQFLEQKQPKQRTLGGAEGLVSYMADDFNEPLDEFRDYM